MGQLKTTKIIDEMQFQALLYTSILLLFFCKHLSLNDYMPLDYHCRIVWCIISAYATV